VDSDNNELPRSRAEAKALGSKRYFTGRPCKHGHFEVRDTKEGKCLECSRVRTRNFNLNNPQKKKNWDKNYSEKNKEKIAANMQRWLEKNPDGRRRWRLANPEYDREWKAANPQKVKAYSRISYDRLMKKPSGKITASIRAGVVKGINKGSKSSRRTFDILGYTLETLMAHLENLFLPGMTWENYGQWHVDHIVPLAAHNYETPDDHDFKRAWSISNLQPLWAFDNISKHARLNKPFQPSLALGI